MIYYSLTNIQAFPFFPSQLHTHSSLKMAAMVPLLLGILTAFPPSALANSGQMFWRTNDMTTGAALAIFPKIYHFQQEDISDLESKKVLQ